MEKRSHVFAMAGLVFGILMLVGGVSAAPTNISSCTTINQSGVYVLNKSIINITTVPVWSWTGCINIKSSNVILDGQGYTIDGVDASGTYGVFVYNASITLTNVTVKNLVVSDWHTGILYAKSENGTFVNITATSNFDNGIAISGSSNNMIANNTANSNPYGIKVASG
ncbi:MAG: hypothetical protein D6733_07680, partial [Methanobacteriota archaeon]